MRRSFSRAAALAAGTAVMLINGVIYAWSIYSTPFGAAFGWTSAELGLCFTVMLGCFCLGGVLGGAVAERRGVGFSIPAGGALGCAGYLLCMPLGEGRLWLLYAAFAAAGLGVGMVYNGVISAVVPRFADKKGFASGVLLMGFGASTLVLGTLAAQLIESPAFGWRPTYAATGALIFLSAVIGRFFVLSPEGGERREAAPKAGLSTVQMLKTARFWVFFALALIGTGFGSGLIAHASYIFTEGGVPQRLAAVAVGLVSVMNGLGRIAFGALHDRFGFRVSLTADALLYIACGVTAALCVRGGVSVPLIAAMMLIGACYGAVPTISASVAQEFFGERHYGQNLSVINLNILVGAFASTIAGGIQTAAGSYSGAIWLFTGLELVSLALVFVLMRVVKSSAPSASEASKRRNFNRAA